MFSSNKRMIAQAIINGPFIVMPVLVGMVLIFMSFEKMAFSMILLSVLGLVFIVLAKWPFLKQGSFFSFGPKNMDRRSKQYYFFGYFLVLVSCLGTWWLSANLSFYGIK